MNQKELSFVKSDNSMTTERFRSLCEYTVIRISARTEPDAMLSYTLYAIDSNGAQLVIYHKNFRADEKGTASLTHEFDPISLAVYQNAVEFFVQIDGTAEELSVTLTENEQIAQQLQNVRRRRCSKKREPRPLKKVLLVGNSILLGMECRYGMCATSPTNDYAYHLSEEIRKVYPACEICKVHGSDIEHSESVEAFEDAFYKKPNAYTGKPFGESLTPDLDLIVLQITDNVNTEKKTATFWQTAETLLTRIRTLCPNAAIVWVYGWYHKPAFFPRLLELCEKYDVEQVDLRGCRCKANEATPNQPYLSADGTQKFANDAWITHPGDSGMRAIADQILTTLREASILEVTE